MKEPKFWYDKPLKINFITVFFLWILSLFFQIGALVKKIITSTKSVSKPVICIGNLTVGGAGKTPTTLSIARYFKEHGLTVAIISRGYKGDLTGPLRVDINNHNAQDVGDEPLFMAHYFPTWISANRYKGAQKAIESGADIILLDDGLQHFTLYQDLKICVVNTKQKFGNEHLVPLGPLREKLQKGLNRIDALIAISSTPIETFVLETNKPLLRANIAVNKEDREALKPKKLLAFAGLAHPQKFFETLRAEGLDVHQVKAFPDHHPYTTLELNNLVNASQEKGLHLVTTEKDWVRLPKEFQHKISQLRITLEYQDPSQRRRLLEPFLKDKKYSRLKKIPVYERVIDDYPL